MPRGLMNHKNKDRKPKRTKVTFAEQLFNAGASRCYTKVGDSSMLWYKVLLKPQNMSVCF